MKRLTERTAAGVANINYSGCYFDDGMRDIIAESARRQTVIERLASIEDILGEDYDLDRLRELVEADRDGRCKILPVNIGDTIYYIGGINGKLIYEASVEEIYIGDGTIALGVTRGFTTFTLQESEYFLKKEDAESALKGEAHA